jgi:myo-inositol 2-dehydrogenase / D-chiro-inositol 1-dehydrogenase
LLNNPTAQPSELQPFNQKDTMNIETAVNRRNFLKTIAAAGIAASSLSSLAKAATTTPTGKKLKVGLIGCGGRGNGALKDCKEAAAALGIQLEVVATADPFTDKALAAGKHSGVPAERCFGGFDGYQKVIASGVDFVILATPPNFRPQHLEAAVAAGKHVFM